MCKDDMPRRRPTDARFYFHLRDLSLPLGASFSKVDGFTRHFTLSGACSNVDTDAMSRFNNCNVSVRIHTYKTPIDEWAIKEHGVENPCGAILIRKALEPKRYPEYNACEAPISVKLIVDEVIFDALWSISRVAIVDRVILSMTIFISSCMLPANAFYMININELDVSEEREYPVTKFMLSHTTIRRTDQSNIDIES